MQCTIEIFLRNQWQECCTLEVADPSKGGMAASTLDYAIDYVFSESAPVSLRHPVNLDHLRLAAWPPFLFDLIPQGKGRHFLRGELGIGDGPAADWPLLCAGAFNPIGRLRIKEAVAYYARHVARQDPSLLGMGFALEEIEGREELFIEHLHIHGMLSAGTSGVQGVAPKFLLTLGKDAKWYADGALPDQMAEKHYLLKLPRGKNASDRKILRNEAAYMRVARRMGLLVAELPHLHGDLLFIPRFDRKVTGSQVQRFHQESAASLAGQTGFDIRLTQNDILAALRKFADDPAGATLEFIKRDVLNLALGNTDNHARNTAMQVTQAGVGLTPLFDFAPMVLDQEGIARAARWRNFDQVEMTNWRDVLAVLAATIGSGELAALRRDLHAFGARLAILEQTMTEEGVDVDIVTMRHHAIVNQIAQLRELGKE